MTSIRAIVAALILNIAALSSACAAVHLYADTAPNTLDTTAYAVWQTSSYSAAANGSFVNMKSGRYPGTSNFLSNEAIAYTEGSMGRRLHWVYWIPGETVDTLAGRFQIKDVADWDGVAYAGDEIDGSEVGWSAPTTWANYDSNSDGTTDGVVGTFGNAWWPEYDEEVINSLAGYMLSYQTYWKGAVRYRASADDPWQTQELRLTLVAEPCTITSSAGSGGSITPSGTTTVNYGDTQTYSITPEPGFLISSVVVDGTDMGKLSSYTFTNVISGHTISASFELAPDFTITATADSGGSISPLGSVTVPYGASKTFTITPDAGFYIKDVLVDGVSVGAVSSYQFTNTLANHTISASFSTITGTVPREDQLIKSWINDKLAASGAIASLTSFLPAGEIFAKMGSPIAETINGVKWINNRKASGDGFDLGLFSSSYVMPCSGASIVMAVKPVRDGIHTDWQACFNVFTYTLSIGIRNDTGNICARRNSTLFNYPNAIIPDGQITILSMIVQPDGSFKVYANGAQIVSEAATSSFTQIAPTWSTTDSMRHINLGRANGSTWSCFNGYIGDTYFYKIALSDTERQQLEAQLTTKFIPPAYQDVANIAALKAKPNGTLIRLTSNEIVIYAPQNAGTRTTSFFYIGEKQGLGGLRIVDKTADTLTQGNTVSNLVGYVRKPASGEPYLELTADVTGNGSAPIDAIGISNKAAADPKTLTNLVKIWGKISNSGASYYLTDGYTQSGIKININGVAVPAAFGTDAFAIVTGILTKDAAGNTLIEAASVEIP